MTAYNIAAKGPLGRGAAVVDEAARVQVFFFTPLGNPKIPPTPIPSPLPTHPARRLVSRIIHVYTFLFIGARRRACTM